MNGLTTLSLVERVSYARRPRRDHLPVDNSDGPHRFAPDDWRDESKPISAHHADYILFMAFLGRENEPRVREAANQLAQLRLSNVGWNSFTDGSTDVSTAVKAYFALKIAGEDPTSLPMRQWAARIRSAGGAERSNHSTKFFLALLGQIPFANCPAVPPECVLLPRWLSFDVEERFAWPRSVLVPLSIIWAYKPVRQLPVEFGIRELFLEPPEMPRPPFPRTQAAWSRTNLNLWLDRWCKRVERLRLTPFRRWAIRRAAQWMTEHLGNGAAETFPAMICRTIALRCLGVGDEAVPR